MSNCDIAGIEKLHILYRWYVSMAFMFITEAHNAKRNAIP